jgi:hypothetical protein
VAQLDRVVNNYVPEGSDDMEWMLWIDGWGEALRNPMMRKISQELDEQSAELLERVIRKGVERAEFVCTDPTAAAMRITALVDGLAVQFAAHDGMMNRDQLVEHVRTIAAWEVGLEPDSLRESASPRVEVAVAAPATDIALRQLISRYCDAVVRRDVTQFASLWSPEAVWQLGKPIEGRDAVVAAFDKAMKGFAWVVQSAPNAVFEVDEANGVGSGRVTISEQSQTIKGVGGSLVGVYHDRYVRHEGSWQFAERRLEVIHQSK